MTDRDPIETELAALAPPPRRTDAAFARAVAAGVARGKSAGRGSLFALPALAAAAAAFALVVTVGNPERSVVDAGVRVAVAHPVAHPVAAPAEQIDASWDDEDDFALPSLDGSSDEELARLDRALDEALKNKP